jgi:hypothetical protein
MSRLVLTQVSLEDHTLELLRELSAQTRIPMSAIVRDVLPAALLQWQRAREVVPKFAGGPGPGSRRLLRPRDDGEQ